MGKGSGFERDVCKDLGLWWTYGQRDDVFWRSSNSGGRATVRRAAGKDTHGQHGDICATDPVGEPLTQLCSIELKRGYKRATIFDLMDCHPSRLQGQAWMKWHAQVVRDMTASGRPYWMIISRGDQRQRMVHIPLGLFHQLYGEGATLGKARPCARMRFDGGLSVFLTTFNSFISCVTPDMIINLSRRLA